MPCYHPLKGYRSKALTVNGKRTFTPSSIKSNGSRLDIPCGQCIGCRLDKSADWATRISLEAKLYEKNCFITLTYAPEFLPENGSLVMEHFQLFMKRLRKKYGKSIRFFHCGEYGEHFKRPHYHACLLNFDFPDKQHLYTTSRGDFVYSSKALDKLWGYGRAEIGSLTFESAAYVARYVTKKINGNLANEHYTVIDPGTGELVRLKSEYTTQSRTPGIGAPYLQKYGKDIYAHDRITFRGGLHRKPPRAFDRRYEITNPDEFYAVRVRREEAAYSVDGLTKFRKKALDNTFERLKVREEVQQASLKTLLKRNLEK